MRYLIHILLIGVSGILNAQTLDDYLKEAAENNPNLKASYTEFEMAVQRVAQVNALPDPTLSFGVFVSPIETRIGPQRARISLSQMFPWFGTLKAKEDVASLLAEAKYQEFLNTKNELYLNVKKAFYPIVELREMIRLQEENITLLISTKELALSSFSSGKGAMVDVLRVEIMIEDLETEIRILQDKIKPLTAVFNSLLNKPENAIVVTEIVKKPLLTNEYQRDSLLTQNIQLKAIDAQLHAAEANEIVSKKKGLPQFGVGLDYAIVGKRTDMDVSGNGKNAFMPMITMSLPIFRGKYNASNKEAELMKSAITYKKENLQNNLLSTYEIARYEMEKSIQQIDLNEKQLEKTDQVLTLLYTSFSNSGKDFVEILRIQQQLLKYEMANATAMKNYYVALAQLDYLISKSE